MNAQQIYQKLLADILLLVGKSASFDYISGKNTLSKLAVDQVSKTVTAERDGGQAVTFSFDDLKRVADAFAQGKPISVEAVFEGSGNSRSVVETVAARLPNVGYLPANKQPNVGPKKLVWFDKPVNVLGGIFDACALLLTPSVVGSTAIASLVGVAEAFGLDALKSRLKFSAPVCQRFVVSNLTKRFCILTGLAGSGKTKLAEAFAMWLCESDLQYRIVAVGADWTGNENLLGYADALQVGKYRAPVNGALELMLRAAADPAKPYFLILDEMNLSHVERYFADFLSAMESANSQLALHSEATDIALDSAAGLAGLKVPPKLSLPSNLFIIGTVNVDETTYMFSPKVLDRANVIEFRASVADMGAFLDDPVGIDLAALQGQGVAFASAFVQRAAAGADLVALVDAAGNALAPQLKGDLLEVFSALSSIGAEFGFRTAKEIARFMVIHQELSGTGWVYKDALDAQVLQKLMPKLHGSARKLSGVLKEVEAFAIAKDLTLTLEKVQRMQQRLERDGFTSFAEA
jgi:hypothetical protein